MDDDLELAIAAAEGDKLAAEAGYRHEVKDSRKARLEMILARLGWLRWWSALTGADVQPDVVRLEEERRRLGSELDGPR